jgi:hypothetical protein
MENWRAWWRITARDNRQNGRNWRCRWRKDPDLPPQLAWQVYRLKTRIPGPVTARARRTQGVLDRRNFFPLLQFGQELLETGIVAEDVVVGIVFDPVAFSPAAGEDPFEKLVRVLLCAEETSGGRQNTGQSQFKRAIRCDGRDQG